MSVKLPVVICVCTALDINAHELHEAARGIPVSIEQLDGEVAANGLPLTISRAVGSAVPILAERLVEHWRNDSGTDSVRIIECCGWSFASRLHGGRSQVIQWRATLAGAELLWSSVDLGAPATIAPVPKIPLIADCTWSTPIHGRVADRQYIQISALCDIDASRALDLMVGRLASDDWNWQRRGPLLVHAERPGVRAQLMATAVPPGAGLQTVRKSSLVLVETRPVTGAHR